MNDLIEQINIYDDSEELAQALADIAKGITESGQDYCGDAYYLKECEVHILGMWALMKEIAQEYNDRKTRLRIVK